MRTLCGVWRLLVSPRWLAWHVLTLGAMATCGFLAAWQWGRAGSAMGSAVNVGYGLQWPLFAVFFGYMWWRFLRMEVAALRGATDGTNGTPAAEPDGPAATPAPAEDAEVAEDTAAAAPPAEAGEGDAQGPPARSPFTARPAGARPARPTDPQLRAYNEELARLADRHREETST